MIDTLQQFIRRTFWHYRRPRSRTVRYAFPMLALLAALLGAGAISNSQQSTVRLKASEPTLEAGRPFSVDVFVSAHVPVNAVELEVSVPPNVKVTGIDRGQSVITLWTQDPYVQNQTVHLSGGTYRKGFIGEHLIATINAEALTSGIAEFTVRDVLLLAGDGSGTRVTLTDGFDGAKLYIAREDGTFADGEAVGLDAASATVIVVTDIDGDGRVTLTDISSFMAAWSSRNRVYDFNGDGRMTFRDFGIILSDYFFQ